LLEALLSKEPDVVKPKPKKATAEDKERMRKEAEEAKAPAPAPKEEAPKKSLAERLREAEAQDKAEAEAKAKPKPTLEMLMSGKVVAKDFVLPKPQLLRIKEDKLKAEAEARRAYFADMAKQEEGSWRDVMTELEKTTKRPIQFEMAADYHGTPDNPEQPPDPEGELYKLWEFRWDFCEPIYWYLGQAERQELIPLRKWIVACLREEEVMPFNTTTTKITGLMTETLRYGYGGSPLKRSIYEGQIDLPEDYQDRETVLLKAKAYAKDELMGTYSFKMGQPLRMGPPSHREGFDKLIHTKGTIINKEGMIRFVGHMCEDWKKSVGWDWEEKFYEANTTEEERAEAERKKQEKKKAEEDEKIREREAKYAECRIVAEKALKTHAESKKRLTSKCYDCYKTLGNLCKPHTVDKCPLRKSIYCYVCSRYGHSPVSCPNKVALALRAGKMPGKDVKDFVLPVSSNEDLNACIVMAGEEPKEGDTPEDHAENRRRLHTICDLLEPPHNVVFRYNMIFVKEKEEEE
jgi:hypothetical protein